MKRSPELEDRLSRFRWRTACSTAESILRDEVGLDPGAFSFATYEDSRNLWGRYLRRFIAQNDLLLTWPASEAAAVRSWLDALQSRSHDRRVLWLLEAGQDVPPVAEVPLGEMLKSGIDVFATKGRDLKLAGRDLRDGLSLELNPVGLQEEFEVTAWGAFAETPI